MPVVTNAVWQVHPGRFADVVGNMSRAKAIHERLGAQVSAVQSVYAGPNSLRINYLMWHKDMAGFGKFSDAQGSDAEWQKFAQEVLQSPNPSATLVSNSLAQDYPGYDTGLTPVAAPGSVLSTTGWQPQPGRGAELAVDIATWRAIAAKHGLTTRTIQAAAAGPATGLMTIAIIHANWSAYAANGEALLADPQFQALWQRVLGPGSPSTSLGQSVGVYLPI